MRSFRCALAFLAAAPMLSMPSLADDMRHYLSETRTLIDQRNYAEALEHATWFYSHALEHDPAMLGVRNSFFLKDWHELAERYEPAMVALKNERNAKTELLASGQGDCRTFSDVMAINRELRENARTIDAYRLLEGSRREIADRCWNVVQKIAVKENAADLIVRHKPDVQSQYQQAKFRYEAALARKPAPGERYAESLKEAERDGFVDQTLDLIAIADILGDTQTSRTLRESAIETIKDPSLLVRPFANIR